MEVLSDADNTPVETDQILPPLKKRKGRNGTGWSKKRGFLDNHAERSRKNSNFVQSICKKLKEWYDVTHTPAVFMAFCNGGIKYYGNVDAMKRFCNEPAVLNQFENMLRSHAIGKDLYEEFEIREDWQSLGVKEKRKLVREISMFGRDKIKWNSDCKPVWWPTGLEFKNPTGSQPFNKDECDLIITKFVENGNCCFEPMATEEDEANIAEPENGDVLRLKESNFSHDVLETLSNGFQNLQQKTEILIALQDELSRLQANSFVENDIGVDEIDIKYRCYAQEHNYEPVSVVPDGNCLYRATSKSLFGNESSWDILKLGCLLELDVKTEDVIAQLKEKFGANVGEIIGEGMANEDITPDIIKRRINEMVLPGAYGGILELVSLSRFTKSRIQLTVSSKFGLFQHFNGAYSFSASNVWGYVKLLSAGNESPNHFAPLMLSRHHTAQSFSERQCWARRFCVVAYGDMIVCRNCLFEYHRQCISFHSISSKNSCGCDVVEKVPESLNWLSTITNVQNTLSLATADDLKNHIQGALNQKTKSFRLQGFYRSLISRGTPTPTWFKSLDKDIVDILRKHTDGLVLDTTKISKNKTDTDRLFEEVVIPELIVYVTSHQQHFSCVVRLSVERWLFGQKCT